MAKLTLTVDGKAHVIEIDDPQMPLLYALRDELGFYNPRFGCGLGQCGACTVHVDGQAVRSCITRGVHRRAPPVTTLAGLGTPEKPHPLQTAWIEEQVNQCGYCINGWIMTGAEVAGAQSAPERPRDQGRLRRPDLPLRHAQCRRQGGQARFRTGLRSTP